MSFRLPGHSINEKLFEGNRTTVFRATCLDDNSSVILKILKQDYFSLDDRYRFQQEYNLMHDLDHENIAHVYKLEQLQDSLLVMEVEDCDGQSLALLLENKSFSLDECIAIALKITQGLSYIHANNIIHKNINPTNIIYNPKTGKLNLIDFGIATKLSQETLSFINPSQLEGTLDYLSPEQTGRMNRTLDYRTDFYSLGITLYELFTGKLPFTEKEPMALIHSHIAKQPVPPHKINPAIPEILSDLLMKLVAKNAEDRYQSARGLQSDLEKCYDEYIKTKQIISFPLAQTDQSGRFHIPQKLYGREEDINVLMQAFDRINQGNRELMLIAGYAGVGKTVLVHEIHRPITEKKGYFIEGKYDQQQRNKPYSGFVQATNKLIDQLLTESSDKLELWKADILAALGNNGQVLIELIPNLSLIIGPQPAVEKLGPMETQNRFNYLFQNFIRLFCAREHPLVLFIDDLQWADSASLNLLEVLLTDENNHHLLIIGAYRNNETDATHPLILKIENIKEQNATVNSILLKELSQKDINTLVSESLSHSPVYCQSLSNLVNEKTSGNAFFVNQFLKSLASEKLLTFDHNQSKWTWDTNQIKAKNITDNVVDLMVTKLKTLPDTTQQIICLAACIGNLFNSNILSIIYQNTEPSTYQALFPAIREGLILQISEIDRSEDSLSSDFKFLHDRVQQAAYSLIPENERQHTHLNIGRLLLKNLDKNGLDENLFDVVNHLNEGKELIDDPLEKINVATLNLKAGIKSKETTAHKSASDYLNNVINLLPDDHWQSCYDLSLTAYEELTSVESFLGNMEQAKYYFSEVLTHAISPLDKVNVYFDKVADCLRYTKTDEGLETAQHALEDIGIIMPLDSPEKLSADVEEKFNYIAAFLEENSIDALTNLPEMEDETIIAAMKLLVQLWAVAYLAGNFNAVHFATSTMVYLSIKHGNTAASAAGYVCYGIYLLSQERFSEAYAFGEIAVKHSENMPHIDIRGKVNNIFGQRLSFLGTHLQHNVEVFKQGFQFNFESGDFIYANWALFCHGFTCFFKGDELNSVLKVINDYLPFIRQSKDPMSIKITELLKQIILCLQGKIQDKKGKTLLDDNTFNETIWLKECIDSKFIAVNWYYSLKAQLCFLLDDYEKALEVLAALQKTIDLNLGEFWAEEHFFYQPLVLSALYLGASPEDKTQYLKDIITIQQKIEKLATSCPENYLHKYFIISAEKARISGQDMEAIDLYNKAIETAHENQYLHHEAIANELAAKYWLAKGQEKIARIYMQDAYKLYANWGAIAKLHDLENKYADLVPRKGLSDYTLGSTSSMDMNSVIKASRLISGEIDLAQLLEKIMRVIMENAGAEKGLLILNKNDKLSVEAECESVDDKIKVLQSNPVENNPNLCGSIIRYVMRTKESITLNDAINEKDFNTDKYIQENRPKSILCTPIINKGKVTGLLYLENNLTVGAFTPERIEMLQMIAVQTAISLENAFLYQDVTHEILERKNAEEALRESEERFALAVKGTDAGIWDWDLRTNDIYFSPRYSSMLGYQEHEVANDFSGWEGFLHPKDKESSVAAVKDYLEGKFPVYEIEFRMLHKDGSYRWILSRGVSLKDDNGIPYRFAGSHIDITDRKLAEAELIKYRNHLEELVEARTVELESTQQELVKKERLAVLGQLTATVSHELRNPLGVIRPSIYTIRKNIDLSNIKLKNTIERIERSVTRCDHIIDELLDFTRISDLNQCVITIDDWLSEILHEQQPIEGIKINTELNMPGMQIAIDPERLRRAVINIYDNACQANYLSDANKFNLEITFKTQLNENRIELIVNDNGNGIPEDILPNIFEPLYSTKNFGVGLGLPTVKQIMELHGGNIEITSKQDRGTKVILWLPLTLLHETAA